MEMDSYGKCQMCGSEFEKILMKKPSAECARKNELNGNKEKIVQLVIEADGMPEYWLDVEGKRKATWQTLIS